MANGKFEFCKKTSRKKRAAFFTNYFKENKGVLEKFEAETSINPSRLKSYQFDMNHTNLEKALAYLKLTLSDYHNATKN